MEPANLIVFLPIVLIFLLVLRGAWKKDSQDAQKESDLKKMVAEQNRRLAAVMAHLNIKDEAGDNYKKWVSTMVEDAGDVIQALDKTIEEHRDKLGKQLEDLKAQILKDKS